MDNILESINFSKEMSVAMFAALENNQHQNPKVFSFTYNVSETEADEIETFLDARANDSDSFTFTPPGESSSSEFVCENWSKSIPYNNRATIQATFREVFEPAS